MKIVATIFFLLGLNFSSTSAQNLVRNPNFTVLDSCPYSYGQINFAKNWSSANHHSPDLFDSCAVGSFFHIPQPGCIDVTPNKDNGFVGVVTYGEIPGGIEIRESITSWLDDQPPLGIDTYCSMTVRPRPQCLVEGVELFSCFTDGLGMAIVFDKGSKTLVIDSKEIINDEFHWKVIDGCYEPVGNETKILIQNFKTNSQSDIQCNGIDPMRNTAYVYIDNIVVAPFEVLPSQIVVCSEDDLFFEGLNFYDLPLSWSDDVFSGERRFNKSGIYTLYAQASDCVLQEKITVHFIGEDKLLMDTLSKCEKEAVTLQVKTPGEILWEDGTKGKTRSVTEPGLYSGIVTNTCGEIDISFDVIDILCNNPIQVANIFSPNGDNINDKISFLINTEIDRSGVLQIFDRWGNQVYNQDITSEVLFWDGNYNGQPLTPGVYIWKYTSSNSSITQFGDITLIR